MRLRVVVAVFAVTIALTAFGALDPSDARSEYERMQRWMFSEPVPLTAPVTLTRDTATWTFESGTVRLMEPASDGMISGLVFQGRGRFRMGIPDRYELAQLRRFTRQADLEIIDQPFTQLVLRTSDPGVAKLFGDRTTSRYAPDSIARRRHEVWLVDTLQDPDAAIVASRLNDSSYLLADIRTAEYGWLLYSFDPIADEEIGLTRPNARASEVWVSLDRAEQRTADGRPGPTNAQATLTHVDVKADLTNYGLAEFGEYDQHSLVGKYVVESSFTGIADSTRALKLALLPIAKDVKAFAADGTPLAVLRDRIGKRSPLMDNRLHDDDFVVLLDSPLKKGEQQRIRFEYELETANFAPGRSWYPSIPDAFDQLHTARLDLTVRKRNELRSMGRMETRLDGPDSETTVWIVDRPTKMVTFSTARRFEEVQVTHDGVPPVIAFGPNFEFANTAKLRNVAKDVANSLQYFQDLFGSSVAAEQYYVTSIAAGHGQSFDGMLLMTENTFEAGYAGASELFRAHEVAHAWWGHKVRWKSYRDQWLSETLAEYSAMMFVQDFVKDGDKHYDEILLAYEGILKANASAGFSTFRRPWLNARDGGRRGHGSYRDELARVGPIGHGWRASTTQAGDGHVIQMYHKGPLVIHMLRTLMRLRTGSDDAFRRTLTDFLAEYDGRTAGTEDFRRVLERNFGGTDMGWFFDAWIYRAEIPSYRWNYDVKPEGEGYTLAVHVERRDVGDNFTTVIPVLLEFEGGKQEYIFIQNDKARQTLTQHLSARPKNVVFAPESSLLASVKKN